MVQWLGRHAFTAEGMGLIPGQEIRSPTSCTVQPKKKKFNSKVLLYSTGNYIQYPMINYNEKNIKKTMSICV